MGCEDGQEGGGDSTSRPEGGKEERLESWRIRKTVRRKEASPRQTIDRPRPQAWGEVGTWE